MTSAREGSLSFLGKPVFVILHSAHLTWRVCVFFRPNNHFCPLTFGVLRYLLHAVEFHCHILNKNIVQLRVYVLLCFFHSRKENNNMPTAWMWLVVITFPYYYDYFFFRFQLPLLRRWQTETAEIFIFTAFCAPATSLVSAEIRNPKSLIIYDEWRRGLSSLRKNISLMRILRSLHQFVKSKLENRRSLNFSFF